MRLSGNRTEKISIHVPREGDDVDTDKEGAP